MYRAFCCFQHSLVGMQSLQNAYLLWLVSRYNQTWYHLFQWASSMASYFLCVCLLKNCHISSAQKLPWQTNHWCRAIWFPRSRRTDGIRGIASWKQNPIKSNGICRIGDFLSFFNAGTHTLILIGLNYTTVCFTSLLDSTCGVNVWSAKAESQCSVIQMFY